MSTPEDPPRVLYHSYRCSTVLQPLLELPEHLKLAIGKELHKFGSIGEIRATQSNQSIHENVVVLVAIEMLLHGGDMHLRQPSQPLIGIFVLNFNHFAYYPKVEHHILLVVGLDQLVQ